MTTIIALVVTLAGSASAGAPLATVNEAVSKPTRSTLAQDPYGQVDFTAYTLQWGEARIGLASSGLGVLPRVQLSTVPLLTAVKVYNGAAKWDVVRAGPLDVAASGAVGSGSAHAD